MRRSRGPFATRTFNTSCFFNVLIVYYVAMKECQIEGCTGRVKARGYCDKHWWQYIATDEARLRRKMNQSETANRQYAKPEVRKRMKQWAMDNQPKIKGYRKAWYQKNRERVLWDARKKHEEKMLKVGKSHACKYKLNLVVVENKTKVPLFVIGKTVRFNGQWHVEVCRWNVTEERMLLPTKSVTLTLYTRTLFNSRPAVRRALGLVE